MLQSAVEAALEADKRERGSHRVAAFVSLLLARPRPGLRVGVDGENTIADGHTARHREIEQRPRRFLRYDLEMQRLATDDATQRDGAVIGLAGCLRRIQCNGKGGRDFERARDADAIELRASLLRAAVAPASKASAISS